MTEPFPPEEFPPVTLPPVTEVADGVWCVPVPMPGAPLPWSLAYLVSDDADGVHVVDPGQDSGPGWDALVAGLRTAGARVEDVVSVVVTHLHPDHLGLVDRLRAASGASVAMHEAEVAGMAALATGRGTLGGDAAAWGVPVALRAEVDAVRQVSGPAPRVDVDVPLRDGDRLAIPGRDVRVLWTPGHTGGHLCLRSAADRLLWTGDHVLAEVNPGLGLGGPTATNPLGDYLASLAAVAQHDDHLVLPGHGAPFRGLAARCAELAAHQTRRLDEVRAVLAAADAPPSVWDVASRLTWTAGWDGLVGFHRAAALAQTAMLVDLVRAGEVTKRGA
ncbi:glyoxylase-like metal-dependent hydrolase (beta-lactamase superfamily II) [Sediminihabitans luteus]|uniref:Glyoxylase-like metal-dependent hydrolase (Beta-lactamase superfamily II) n=1 Tax=Sediminihabitans luteus TaxID=1138585 RepID=A0A2M9CPM8_9CELL|nr:MBL fold metallo-hydrolase [Sediminihabitans luteus]PJJ73846.1 glyoxylase-like metal-dependent hydrolase (beta-lactamase superfamily II) [Sediminihabitans luteus]GII98244.1 MBL fold hydrolase [Sediminihabitans luteus]